MKQLKTVVALILALALAVPMCAMAAPQDVIGTEYEKAVTLLSDLNIMVGDEEGGTGNFRPEENLTRREFAVVVTKMLGIYTDSQTDTIFPDVTAEDWGSGTIQMAADKGIIQGYDDGTFGKDDPVTYPQAIKMLVCALGYDYFGKAQGGYPAGYLSVASQEGITDGIAISGNDPVKRGVIAQMVFNALDVDVMIQNSFSADEEGLVSYPGRTVLTENLDIQKVEGIVYGNHSTMLNEESTLREGEVQIGDVIYKAGSTNVEQFLGYNVVVYARDKEDDRTILSVYEEDNEILTVDAEFISPDTTTTEFVYYDDDKIGTNSERIDLYADMIFNGRFANFAPEDMQPILGDVTIIDNDKDGQYEVVVVNSFVDCIVDSVNAADYTIYFRNGVQPIELKPTKDVTTNIYKDGVKVDLSVLKKWDIATVGASKDQKNYNIYVSAMAPVVGQLSEIGKETVIINGAEYKVSPGVLNKLEQDGIAPGTMITAYLNYQGKLAAAQIASSVFQYGVLLKAYSATEGVVDNTQLRILGTNGQWTDFNTMDNVTLNGDRVTGPEVATAPVFYNGSNFVPQLIAYQVNSEGKVRNIETATYGGGNGVLQNLTSPTLGENSAGNLQYRRGSQMLDKYYISGATSIFTVPGESDRDNPDAYVASTADSWQDTQKYKVSLFATSADSVKKGFADIVVYYPQNASENISDGTRVGIVEKITTYATEGGDLSQKIYVYYMGKEVVLNAKAGKTINGLYPGDVIRMIQTGEELGGYKKIYAAEPDMSVFQFMNMNSDGGYKVELENKDADLLKFWGINSLDEFGGSNFYVSATDVSDSSSYSFAASTEDNNFVLRCRVVDKIDDFIVVERCDYIDRQDDKGEVPVFTRTYNLGAGSPTIVGFNGRTGKASVKTISDINIGSELLIKTRVRGIQDIFIFENMSWQ